MTTAAKDRIAGVFVALALALMVAAFAGATSGCGDLAGLDAVQKTLPKVANGVHTATGTGHASLHVLAQRAADKCRADGITVKESCKPWQDVESVRVALEEVAQAIEADFLSIDKNVAAFRKVQAAIKRLKGE